MDQFHSLHQRSYFCLYQYLICLLFLEAATGGFLREDVLKFSQNSQENTCAKVSFSIIEKETLAQVFSCEFCENFKNTFFTENLRWLLLRIVDKLNIEKDRSIFCDGGNETDPWTSWTLFWPRESNQNWMVAYVGEGGVRIFELFCGCHKWMTPNTICIIFYRPSR